MADEIKLKLGLEGVPQVQAGAAAAANALGKIGQAGAQLNAQTKLTGQQTAQLSAQLQDFAVQVQAGGNPLTALIQQGSQLSAVFGGVGNAARAVGSLITPAVVAVTGLAAGIGALGAAWVSGYKDSKAFADGIALTGNAAGITEARFNSMADSIGKRTLAGVGVAREALQTLVATGKLSGEALTATATAAASLARVSGESGADAARKLLEYTTSAAEGARKLNDQYNFLTAAQYASIKAAEEAGNKNLAVAETMRALDGRLSTTIQNLGTIERGWIAVKNAISGAIDAMASIGRTSTPQDQLAVVDRAIEANARRTDREDSIGPSGRRQGGDAQLAALKQQQAYLQEIVRLETRGAEASAARAAQNKAAIAFADDEVKFLTRRAQMEREIKAIRDQAKAAGKSTEDPEVLRRIAVVTERYAEAKKKGADAFTTERDAARAWAAVMERAAKITADAEGKTLGLSKAQGELVEYLSSPAYAQNSAEMQQLAVAALIAAHNAEELGKATKASAEMQAEAAKVYRTYVADLERGAVAAHDQLQRMLDEEQAAQLAASANLTLAEAIARVTIERLREKQAQMDIPDSAAYDAITREIDAREKQLQVIRQRAAREATEKQTDDARRAWEQTNDQIGQSLADALMEGGRSAGDYIKSLFRTMVLKPIVQAIVQPIAGAVTNIIGGATGQAAGNATGSILSGASTASTIYQAYQGGGLTGTALAAGNYGAVYSGSAYGTAFGSQQSAMLASQEAGMVSQAGGSTMGAWASYAGYAALIYAAAQYASKLYGEGFTGSKQLEGKDWYDYSDKAVNLKLFNALGLSDKWAEILSGSVRWNHMFGRAEPRVTDQGITGFLGSGDFEGVAYRDVLEKGGLFRSDRRYTDKAAITDPAIEAFFDDAAASVLAQAKKYGEALGLPAEQLAGISTEIRVSLGQDTEKNKEAIIKALGQYGDALLAGYTDAIKPLQQYGETVAQTIERVGGALLGVNGILEQLGADTLAASVAGGGAAIDLAARFGDKDGSTSNLASAAGAFYDAFYSEQEKVELLGARLAKTFSDLGLTMPSVAGGAESAKDAYRDLVTGQDLTTEKGRAAFTALIALSGAFDQVAQSSDALRAGLDEAIARVLPKFQSPAERTTSAYGAISRDLQGVGLDIGVDALLRATKDEIRTYVESIVTTGSMSIEAQTKIVQLADALAGLKDDAATAAAAIADQQTDLKIELERALGNEAAATVLERQRELDALRLLNPALAQTKEFIYAATDAANAAAKSQRLADSVDAVATEFLSGPELTSYYADQISAILAKGGITVDPKDIPGSTKAQVRQLYDEAIGVDAKQAVADAAQVWLRMVEPIEAAADALKAFQDNLQDFIGSLKVGDLSPLDQQAQLDAAQAQYASTLAKAQAGDETARSKLPDAARAYLDEGQGAYASGGAYTAIYDRVLRDLEALALTGATGTAAALAQPAAGAPTYVDGPAGSSGGLSGAPQPEPLTPPALIDGFSSAAADGQIAKLEAKLDAIVTELQSRGIQLDALITVSQVGHTGTIAATESLRAPLEEAAIQARLATVENT
jgi:phage-related minor tail protein